MRKSKTTTRLRHGFGAIDVIVSVALMSLVLSIAVQMSSAMLRHRSAVTKQRIRAEAVSNLMEVCQSLPFDNVDATTIEQLAAAISEDEWDIRVESDSETKKISLQLKPQTKLDRLRAPLIAWRYPNADDSTGERQ